MRRKRKFKVIIERHKDGYVGYPIGLNGVVVGQGDTYEEALADTRSAIRFHIESFDAGAFDAGAFDADHEEVLEAFVAEVS